MKFHGIEMKKKNECSFSKSTLQIEVDVFVVVNFSLR